MEVACRTSIGCRTSFSLTAATMHRCSNCERRRQALPYDGRLPRSTEIKTRNVRDVDRPFKVFVVSLVLTLTLHSADDPIVFWRGRIAKLAKGLFRYVGQEREEYGAHRNAGESSKDNGLGT